MSLPSENVPQDESMSIEQITYAPPPLAEGASCSGELNVEDIVYDLPPAPDTETIEYDVPPAPQMEAIIYDAPPAPVSVVSLEKDVNSNALKHTLSDDSEDEMPTKMSKEAVSIPGTSITLTSDEDIAKWREERRKNWLKKISNNKDKYREEGDAEEKEDTFSLNKEPQGRPRQPVHRYNPRPNLNNLLIQRGFKDDNLKILQFIKELGDAGMLQNELTEKEAEERRNNPRGRGNRGRYNGPSRFNQARGGRGGRGGAQTAPSSA